ncbi:MAG: long-chain-fatty-acid--CoA ligase, partial [Alphaproteobacteria bacterium]
MVDMSRISSLADITRYHARHSGRRVALIMDGRETTYAELDAAANQVGHGLIAAACEPGDRVAYLAKNSDLYFEILFGAAKTRCAMVGVNWRLAAPELIFVLNDARARVLFVDRDFYEMAERILPDLTTVKTVIALDGEHRDWPAYEDWRSMHATYDPGLKARPEDDVIQLYTSGTTGHPKGVQITNHTYMATFEAGLSVPYWEWRPETVNFVCMPLFHVAGVNVGTFGLLQGCKNVVLREVDVDVILDLIETHRIDTMFMVPALILGMVHHPRTRKTDLSSLKQISYGASPIAEDLLIEAQKIFKCDFIQFYGMTETNGVGTLLPPEDHDPAKGKLRSCGRPWPGVEVKVVDANDREVPQGEVGEVVIRGEVVMKGYWNRPEATQQSVVDGWMHTGDAGYFDRDGYLFIYDRVKDMIVSGGENIYPAEVENALFGHPAVADVAVIGVPDKEWGEAVKAIVVLKEGMEATEDEIRDFARERIAGYKVP